MTINGQAAGETPLDRELPPGEVVVSVSLSGHEKVERKVVVEKGKTVDLALTLKKIYPMNPYKK